MTRPTPQLSPFAVSRGEAGIDQSIPVVGLNFKGAMVKLDTDETLVTSTAVVWDGQVYDNGNWFSPSSGTLFVVPASTRKVRLSMGAYMTPSVADMQFYFLQNGNRVPGASYSQTASGNVGFTWTSPPIDAIEGDLFELIPEFGAGAPVLDADEVGGTWWAIEQISAVAPSTATRGALITLTADLTTQDFSAGKRVDFLTVERDTDVFFDVNSAGMFTVKGGMEFIKLRCNIGMSSVTDSSITVLKFQKNGADLDPNTEIRQGMSNTAPALSNESYVISVVSGDTFNVNLLQIDNSITLLASKCYFEIEVVQGNFLANVDSYHGQFFAGVPTSEQETHRILAPFEFTIPSSLDGATGTVGILPNSIETWSFQKNGIEFATADISLLGSVSFASSLEQNFGPFTDVLTFVAPNSGSAGNVSFVLRGNG
ncbi:MAG: hypothetical protein V3S55_03850 [Nitrospiraceae bacterium]